MDIIFQFIISYFATIGFAIFFNAPFNTVFATGFSGALAWLIYFILSNQYNSVVTGAFLGAFMVGLFGEILAIKYKKPATVFITPGIVSLVPGAGMYYTMFYLIQGDLEKFANYGIETFFVAATIAIGVIASTVFSSSIKRFNKRS